MRFLLLLSLCYLFNASYAYSAANLRSDVPDVPDEKEEEEEASALVVIGGMGGTTIEVVSLDGAEANCKTLTAPTEAKKLSGHKAFVFDDKLMFCGGKKVGQSRKAECYEFDKDTEKWTKSEMALTKPNINFGLAVYGADDAAAIVVAGGHSGSFSSGTEVSDGAAFEKADGALTAGVMGNCLVTVSESTVLSIGGATASGNVKTVQEFDTSSGAWSDKASMTKARSFHACVKLSCDKVLVIGGGKKTQGDSTTEIYDIEGDSWSDGPELPSSKSSKKYIYGDAVLVDGTPTLVGGFPDERAIYQLSDDLCADDADVSSMTWEKSDTKLSKKRRQHSSVMVPLTSLPDSCA